MKKRGYTVDEIGLLLKSGLEKHLQSDNGLSLDFVDHVSQVFSPEDADSSHNSGVVRAMLSQSEEKMKWKVEDSYPISAHGFFADDCLGTYGIVHYLNDEQEEDIRELLENAAYVRHLLIDAGISECAPPLIEVVLVVLNWDESVQRIADALRKISESSTFLHSIGVSLLRAEQHGDPGALRRAFPWLLSANRKWFGCLTERGKKSKRLNSLRLDNFRVEGKRDWSLPGSAAIHVVHGPNGSGKSSLVEALEFVVTGSIQRLEDERHENSKESEGRGDYYRRVLTHQFAGQNGDREVSIEAKFDSEIIRIGFEPDDQASLNKELKAGAFKFDQRLSNSLIYASAADRARTFMENFFPEESAKIEDYSLSRKRVKEAWERCPEWVRKEFETAEGFVISLGKDVDPVRRFLPGELAKKEHHELLMGYMNRAVSADGRKSENLRDAYDRTWLGLVKQSGISARRMDGLVKLLVRLNEWQVSETRAGRDEETSPEYSGDPFSAWLREIALYDLLEKEFAVTSTLVRADELGWQPEKGLFAGMRERHPRKIENLQQAINESKARQQSLRMKLKTSSHFARGGNITRSLELESIDVEALNWSQSFLELQTFDGSPLGEAVRQAVDAGRVLSLSFAEPGSERKSTREIRLGESPGSLRSVLDRAKQWCVILEEIERYQTGLSRSLSEMNEDVDQLRKAVSDSKQVGEGLIQQFRERVEGEMSEAANELMSLMTPARWAYEDIEMKSDIDEENRALHVRSGDASASVKLNTAELNTMALALFLLSAVGRKENPIDFVILDDPFENMDELTSVTVARALGRLARLWRNTKHLKNWRVALFLHGGENLERIRGEISCITYFLPWLAPCGHSKGEVQIETEKSRLRDTASDFSAN